MSEHTSHTPDLEALKNAVREAVESGSNKQARVRELTLSALSSGHPDLQQMKQVTRTVIEGISEAAESSGARTATIIQQSLSGVEDALSQAGEASVLALREAAGRAGEFASHDLKQAVDELRSLQHVYADALGEVVADVARAGADTVSAIFEDIHRHARNSGTSFAGQLAESLAGLHKLLPADSLQAGAERMYATAETLGNIASSILRGIQQDLDDRPVKADSATDTVRPEHPSPGLHRTDGTGNDEPDG